ncbi:MAG TPA: hypothetical protein VLF87_02350 [Patescibacteria group bacterium]|nr:hypothetical protein [Patescibacteria group bacterium]
MSYEYREIEAIPDIDFPETTPVTVLIAGVYYQPDGTIAKFGHRELSRHVRNQMSRLTSTDARRAGRVASALENLWKMAGSKYGTEKRLDMHTRGWPSSGLPLPLTERQTTVLEMLSGSDEQPPASAGEVSKALGVTPGYVHQVHKTAESKARSLASLGTLRARYDALTFNGYFPDEVTVIPEQRAQDVAFFLLAELNPELIVNENYSDQLALDFEG